MDPSLYGYSIDDFKEEARELLARAEDVLSEIRESPQDREKVNALFRVIHSLKGSAAYAGLEDVNTFSHLYEGFLGELRNNKYEVSPDVINMLVRARDYLEDLIFHPEDTDLVQIDDTVSDPMQQLAMALKGRKVSKESGNIRPLSPPLGGLESEPPTETEIPVKKAPQEQKKISLSTQDPAKMSQKDVIKVTITNAIKSLYSSLKSATLDKELTSRLLTKLEDSVLWAFGDSSATIKPLDDMKGLISGPVGPDELSQLRKRFNSLAAALKEEIVSLDGPEKEKVEVKAEADVKDELEEKKKASADAIRGASKDDIVKITLFKSLDNLASLLEEDNPDYSHIKRVVGRLRDLNRWAFNEDELINRDIKAIEELLRRPYDAAVAQEMRARYSSIRPPFIAMLAQREKDEVGAYGHTPGQESEVRSEDIPGKPETRGAEIQRLADSQVHQYVQQPGVRSQRPKPAPATSGSTLRVRSEDVESLIAAIGELAGLEPKDFERLQAHALQLRMVPVGELFSRFRKVVRDLSEELGKEIEIEISGESVRLDKVIADRLNEPILHMVRNAAGHGIESPEEREKAGKGPAGLIRLNAYQEGGQIIIEVSDNGKGISLEKVRKRGMGMGLIKSDEKVLSEKAVLDLIFAPGFSTMEGADKVSGRGVGMDVVKDVITSLQGTVSIDTKEGMGTTFRLQLPLTLAIIKAMVLEQSGNKIAIPATFVDRVITMTDEELKAGSIMDNNRLSIDLANEGDVLPLVNLSQLFGLESKSGERCVVVVKAGMGQKAALVVDSALGRQPLMVKPLDRFSENRYFSSASYVNDEVILVLNTPSLMAA